ncbi:MAG: hypothetical protein IPG50_10805 [Myxococcales bacterium]|nr:hypothetical protein [Myxococcales bacterium]
MDDPVLRGRVIAIAIGIVIAGALWLVISRSSADVADPTSDAHKKIMERGCEAAGHERGTPRFATCVERATAQCGGGGGVARNLATCARGVAESEF